MRTELAEQVIRKYLPRESGFSKKMAEAVNYSMLAGSHGDGAHTFPDP